MVPVGWGFVVVGLGAHAWARRRDNELLETLSDDVALRHETVSRGQIGGLVVGMVCFLALGRGPLALAVTLSVLGTSALGATLFRVQLPAHPEHRRLLIAELLASWTLYAGAAMVLLG